MRTFITHCLLLAAFATQAQIEIKSTGRIITERAVEGSIVVVRQAYQLQDSTTMKTFGRGGRDEFSMVFSIGVSTQAGLVLTDMAIEPWRFDDNFRKYEGQYRPIISKTELRHIAAADTFHIQPLKGEKEQPEGLWLMKTIDGDAHLMEIENAAAETEGWMVWCYADQTLAEKPDANVSLNAVSQKLSLTGGKKEHDVTPPVAKGQLLGGLYVAPAYIGGGRVAFRLVGMAVCKGDKWMLRTPFVNMKLKAQAAAPQPGKPELTQDEEPQLTPIKQDKKKKTKK